MQNVYHEVKVYDVLPITWYFYMLKIWHVCLPSMKHDYKPISYVCDYAKPKNYLVNQSCSFTSERHGEEDMEKLMDMNSLESGHWDCKICQIFTSWVILEKLNL